MNRLALKLNVYSLFLLLAIIISTVQASEPATELAKMHLRTLLRERPDLADKFLKEVEKKDGGKVAPGPTKPKTVERVPTKTDPLMPARPPEFAEPEGPDKQRREPEVLPEPTPAPAPKPWMTDSELSDLNTIFTRLESNAARTYACLKAFFCKTNCQPYRMHAECLKSQVADLHNNLLARFPQAETPERRALFAAFQNLAQITERSETALLKVIGQKYEPSFKGVLNIKAQFNNVTPLLEGWQKQSNQTINSIKGLIKPEMVPRLNKLRDALNRMYNFQSTLPLLQIPGIIAHRLKT